MTRILPGSLPTTIFFLMRIGTRHHCGMLQSLQRCSTPAAGGNGRSRLPHAVGANPANEEILTWLDARFASFLDYVSTVRSHSAWSARWYVCGYQNFRRYLIEGVSLEPETFQQRLFGVDSWVHWNRTRGLGPVATNTYWRAVRRFFVDLEERDSVQNPFRGLKAPPLPRRNPKAHAPAMACGKSPQPGPTASPWAAPTC